MYLLPYEKELFFCGPVIPRVEPEKDIVLRNIGRLYEVRPDGTIFNTFKKKEKKPYYNTNGYAIVNISPYGTGVKFSVHRLVALLHIPNPNNYPCINHKNGIKTDNRVENLEWCTHKMNTRHAVETGLIKTGPRLKVVKN